MDCLNTIVQFFAALYVTITVDSIMFKRFWTPDIYSEIDLRINEYKFALSTPTRSKLMNTIRGYANKIESQSRKRGGFFLLLCISLMVLFAFEDSFSDIESVHLCTLSTTIIAGVISIIGIFRWSKWRHILICYLFVLAFFFAVYNIIESYNAIMKWADTNHTIICKYTKLAIIVLLLIPILIRLYINWLHSVLYSKYLILKLQDEYNAYEKTKFAIAKKDQSLVDNRYDSIYKKIFFTKDSSDDQVDTELVTKLVEYLIDDCKPVSTWDLINFQRSKEYKKYNINQEKALEKYSLPQIDISTSHTSKDDDITLSRMCKLYEKSNGISIAKFCNDHGIDESRFREYRKDYLKKKK